MAFRGHFDYSLDAKNRLNVPPKFRAAFSGGVVLAKALEPCVDIWTPEAFERHTDAFLSGLNPLSAERRKLTRLVADRIGRSGKLVCIDRDPAAEERFEEFAREVQCDTRFLRMDYAEGLELLSAE